MDSQQRRQGSKGGRQGRMLIVQKMNTQGSLRRQVCFKYLSLLWQLGSIFLLGSVEAYQLATNVIVNGDFSLPPFQTSSAFMGVAKGIPGWTCKVTCELNYCERFLSWDTNFAKCTGKVLDLASSNVEVITQTIELQSGFYQLDLSYYYPSSNPHLKTILVYFNTQLIFFYTPLVSENGDLSRKTLTQVVSTRDGTNNLTFTMGNYSTQFGYKIGDVSLRRILNSAYQQLIQKVHMNSLITWLVAFPGSRSVFAMLMSSFVNLDRLQLYHYHNRNHSYYAKMLFNHTNALLQTAGQLLTFMPVVSSLADSVQSSRFFDILNFKRKYPNEIPIQSLDDPSLGSSFIINQRNFFVRILPSITIIYLLLLLFFHLTKHSPISKFARRYSFLAMYLSMLLEGNVEELTFFSVGEFIDFFSKDFSHKLINTFILMFFLLLIIIACAFLLLVLYHYKKRVKCFLENNFGQLNGVAASFIDRFFMAFLFGLAHRLLLGSPDLQLGVLAALQLVWITFRLYFLCRNSYKSKFLLGLQLSLGVARICLQISLYLYANYSQWQITINNQIHFYLIIVLICLFSIAFLVGVFRTVQDIYRKKKYFSSRVANDLKSQRKGDIKNSSKQQNKKEQVKRRRINFCNDTAAKQRIARFNDGIKQRKNKPILKKKRNLNSKALPQVELSKDDACSAYPPSPSSVLVQKSRVKMSRGQQSSKTMNVRYKQQTSKQRSNNVHMSQLTGDYQHLQKAIISRFHNNKRTY